MPQVSFGVSKDQSKTPMVTIDGKQFQLYMSSEDMSYPIHKGTSINPTSAENLLALEPPRNAHVP
jgi:hypothetical protein